MGSRPAARRRPARPWRALRAVIAAAACLVATACVSMPTGGPVLPFQGSSAGAAAQDQAGLQIVAQPPGPGWSQGQVVLGFLAASSSDAGQRGAAREYLTPQASRAWRPDWSATVFKDGPQLIGEPKVTRTASGEQEALVTVGGSVQANVLETGTYAVAGATPTSKRYTYTLVKYGGQWRISSLGNNPLLLTTSEFAAAYQLRNLYFFDPAGQHLVPDPVYVPVQAAQGDLVNGLVKDLISQPPDWLSGGATATAFPRGTKLAGNVTVDGGTAAVNLGGTVASAPAEVKEKISAQLLLTLSAADKGQQVKSVALSVNGKPFYPTGAQGNPVQASTSYTVVAGPQAPGFYFLGARGELMRWNAASGKAAKVATVAGGGFSALAVSPDGSYLALVRDGTVYTAAAKASSTSLVLTRRALSGVTSVSWDEGDDLWAAAMSGSQLWRLPASTAAGIPQVLVDISSHGGCGGAGQQVTALRVAPDGVRVALAFGGQQPTLAFGAIASETSPSASRPKPAVTVSLSPFCVSGQQGAFAAVSWYGPDNVIALSQPGDGLTEYPVNGGTPVTIASRNDVATVTASGGKGGGLIVGTTDGSLYLSSTTAGDWTSIGSGTLPAYPG